MKKKMLSILTFLIIGIFFSIQTVYAGSINWAGVKIECIYDDGGAYSSVNNVYEIPKNYYVCYKHEKDDKGNVIKDDKGNAQKTIAFEGFYDDVKEKYKSYFQMNYDGYQSEEKKMRNLCDAITSGANQIPNGFSNYGIEGKDFSLDKQNKSVQKVSYDINRMPYNLYNATQENNTLGTLVYTDNPFSKDNRKCSSYMGRGNLVDDDNITTYFSFDNDYDDLEFDGSDIDADVSWWAKFWYGESEAKDDLAKQINDSLETFELVSERYILTEDAGEPDFVLTYVSESEQVIGSTEYVYILVYSDVILLKTSERTTRLYDDEAHFSGLSVDGNKVIGLAEEDVIFINEPEPESLIDSTGIMSYKYKPGQIRYTFNAGSTGEGDNTRRFVLANATIGVCDTSIIESNFCEKLPMTSQILRKVIKYVQILVPVLLIGLSAFELGKIVMSGNLEEELPKIRKRLIARFIAALVIFFLPYIILLIINMIKTSDMVEQPGPCECCAEDDTECLKSCSVETESTDSDEDTGTKIDVSKIQSIECLFK